MSELLHDEDDKLGGDVEEQLALANAAPRDSIHTPLSWALCNGKTTVAQTLLDNGADPNGKNKVGAGPLFYAVVFNYVEIATRLVGLGTDVFEAVDKGKTDLHIAAADGSEDLVQLLLDYGADVHAIADQGQGVLASAVAGGSAENMANRQQLTGLGAPPADAHDKIVQLLLDKGADIEAKAMDGSTPLHLAARYGTESVARSLIQRGADIEAQLLNGSTPLHSAVSYRNEGIARLLLESGADVNAKPITGITPLMVGVSGPLDRVESKSSPLAVIKVLLEAGANINSRALHGVTALHAAVKMDQLATARLLLEKGADVNAQDNHGDKPIDMITDVSLEAHHLAMRELLLGYMGASEAADQKQASVADVLVGNTGERQKKSRISRFFGR